MRQQRVDYLRDQLATELPKAVAFDCEKHRLADEHAHSFTRGYCDRIRNQDNPYKDKMLTIEAEILQLEMELEKL